MVAGMHPIRLGYVVVFSLTAVACFAAISRSRGRIEDPETRWGLNSLLATSGLWAAFHVGRILAPSPDLKLTFYVLGLTAGLATVGAWLYFCSAYAGESYHRQPLFRRLALGLYLGIIGVKLTSSIHGLYFATAFAEVPFPHLEIRLGVLHWVVTGLAYALSAVGFYILFDLFQDSSYATRRLGVLVGLAGLPVVFDIVGYASPGVIVTMNYEPIGVALFALGVLYVADGSFIAVRRFGREQLLDEIEEGIVLLDSDGAVRDVNDAARRIFPGLADSVGTRLSAAAPGLARYLPVEQSTVVEFTDTDPPRYYLLSPQELTVGQTPIGEALVFTDITDVERQRRTVEQQQEQLDEFAEAITHELRNAVTVIHGHLQIIGTRLDPESRAAVEESITAASAMSDRLADVVSDLAMLAEYGQPVDRTTTLDVAGVAEEAFRTVAGDGIRLAVTGGTIEAEEGRLRTMFENLFEFARRNGATRVEVERTDGGLVVTDDGEALSASEAEGAFAYGEAVPDSESGMLLPVVRTLAEAHGWESSIDTDYRDGVRVEFAE